ncbi:MAG: hypothetical protein ACI9UR_000175, partial [Bacteroidia bacterium]
DIRIIKSLNKKKNKRHENGRLLKSLTRGSSLLRIFDAQEPILKSRLIGNNNEK